MIARTLLALAGVLASAASAAPQDVPMPSDDVVVTGERPTIRPGLWQVDYWAIFFGVSHRTIPSRIERFCVTDGEIGPAMQRVPGDGQQIDGAGRCSRMRVTIRDGKVAGGYHCGLGRITVRKDLYGELGPETMDVRVVPTARSSGTWAGSSETRTRVQAKRVGECG